MASTSLWFVLLANSGDPSQLQSCQSFLPTTMHALRTDKCFQGVSGQYFQATCSGSVASLKTYTSATCASNALVQTEGFTVGCSSVSPNATVASKVLCQATSKVTEPPVDYLDYVYYKYYERSETTCSFPIAYTAYLNQACFSSPPLGSSTMMRFPEVDTYSTANCSAAPLTKTKLYQQNCAPYDGLIDVPYTSTITTNILLGGSNAYNFYIYFENGVTARNGGIGWVGTVIIIFIFLGIPFFFLFHFLYFRFGWIHTVRTVPNPEMEKYKAFMAQEPGQQPVPQPPQPYYQQVPGQPSQPYQPVSQPYQQVPMDLQPQGPLPPGVVAGVVLPQNNYGTPYPPPPPMVSYQPTPQGYYAVPQQPPAMQLVTVNQQLMMVPIYPPQPVVVQRPLNETIQQHQYLTLHEFFFNLPPGQRGCICSTGDASGRSNNDGGGDGGDSGGGGGGGDSGGGGGGDSGGGGGGGGDGGW